MTPLVQNLLALTDAYTVKTGVSVNKVSKSLFNDGAGIRRLQDGGDLLTGNYLRAVRWFSERWPADLAWPEGVDRPFTSSGPSDAGEPVDAACDGPLSTGVFSLNDLPGDGVAPPAHRTGSFPDGEAA